MVAHQQKLEARIKAITYEADRVISLDLRPVTSGELPPFSAGAHIEVQLPNGIERSYSIASPQCDNSRYLLAVQLEPESKGGSLFIHQSLRVGTVLMISPPRNHFPLKEDAEHSILIAGGIGITPLWCMAQRLESLKRSYTLVYAVRTRNRAAFLQEISANVRTGSERLSLHFDDENDGAPIDIARIVAAAPAGSQFYCCGPLPMLASFEAATAGLPPDVVHVEYFAPKAHADIAGGFEVVLARSGRTVSIESGKTILESLLAAGVADLEYSCREGICGICETRIIDGIPDHRDSVLTAAERNDGRSMMICCSGSKSGKLVLDL
jgi:tetrachlorobenzoquinone reductase